MKRRTWGFILEGLGILSILAGILFFPMCVIGLILFIWGDNKINEEKEINEKEKNGKGNR